MQPKNSDDDDEEGTVGKYNGTKTAQSGMMTFSDAGENSQGEDAETIFFSIKSTKEEEYFYKQPFR